MDHDTYKIWNSIDKEGISENGEWITYIIENEDDRSDLVLYNSRTGNESIFPNSKKLLIDKELAFMAFRKSVHPDTIKAMKRRKVKKKKLPKDTLVLFNPSDRSTTVIENLDSYKISNEKSGWIAYKIKPVPQKKDTTLIKDESKENGSKLYLMNVIQNEVKEFPFCFEYDWSEENGMIYFTSSGTDTLDMDHLLIYNVSSGVLDTVNSTSGEYHQIAFDKGGQHLAFSYDEGDEESEIQLSLYDTDKKSLTDILPQVSNTFLKEDWEVNKHKKPYFLDNHEMLVFGTSPIQLEEDTTLLAEEKVELDLWHYQDGRLMPRQDVNLKKDEKKAYSALYNTRSRQMIQIGGLENEYVSLNKKLKGKSVLSMSDIKYRDLQSWEGINYNDIFLTDIDSGKRHTVAEKIAGRALMSPTGNHLLWYDRVDTTWVSYNIQKSKKTVLTRGKFYDELNDRPMHPYPSGGGRWVKDDKIILYDHYDMWLYDLDMTAEPIRLTYGREKARSYRYVELDKELESLSRDTTILIKYFNETDKSAGLGYLNLEYGKIRVIEEGPYKYASTIIKAKESDDLIFTKESFELFPDLIHTNTKFENQKKISDANPQQPEYAWGSIELYNWEDYYGNQRNALLAKPPGFDPKKKYPLIVNFYEKSSNRLHNHRKPYPHRSTINYSYYTNQGYVVFNPDIHYTNGYPGESCYQAVMASVDALVKEGFIDEEHMGLQGHSWGGYQIAYILTKTDRFICAEAGAPVVNMTSAYGGIRWGSGRSRMFQYEHTQSRLGATLWERPDLYLYNSPLFQLDKVNTPVLILHNDNDGAVPWYQGIEYFVGLRRLGKPAWLLNYNGEPHWPVKKQNRMDFNIRMQQFFDHYLKGKEMAPWMKNGIPRINKGKDNGLGLDKKD